MIEAAFGLTVVVLKCALVFGVLVWLPCEFINHLVEKGRTREREREGYELRARQYADMREANAELRKANA